MNQLISSNIFSNILSFLEKKDIISIMQSCKFLYNKTIETNCINKIFLSETHGYSDNNKYVFYPIDMSDRIESDYIPNKKNYVDYYNIKSLWKQFIYGCIPNPKMSIETINEILTNKIYYSRQLRRESFCINSRNEYQFSLCDNFYNAKIHSLIIDDIFRVYYSMFADSLLNSEYLDNIRCYNISEFDLELVFNDYNIIHNTAKLLHRTVVNYCKTSLDLLIHTYKNHGTIRFIERYVYEWRNLSDMSLNFNEVFKNFTDIINDNFNLKYCKNKNKNTYIQKFSIIEMFTRVWINMVYNNIAEYINISFASVLNFMRLKTIDFVLHKNINENDIFAIKNISNNKNILLNNNDYDNYNKLFGELSQLNNHMFENSSITNNLTCLRKLLYHFSTCIIDISINTITVKFLGENYSSFDKPYVDIENIFAQETKLYYVTCYKYLCNEPDKLELFIKLDLLLFDNNLYDKKEIHGYESSTNYLIFETHTYIAQNESYFNVCRNAYANFKSDNECIQRNMDINFTNLVKRQSCNSSTVDREHMSEALKESKNIFIHEKHPLWAFYSYFSKLTIDAIKKVIINQ